MLNRTQRLDDAPASGDRDEPVAGPAVLAEATGLIALGQDLKACLDNPETVTVGAFAAVIERLHSEFRMIGGEADEAPPARAARSDADDLAALFDGGDSRELSNSDMSQIEAALAGDGT